MPLKDFNEVEPQKVKSIVNGQICISYESSPVVKLGAKLPSFKQ